MESGSYSLDVARGIPQMYGSLDAGALSASLLDFYRYSRELTLARFQGRLLERLAQELPFDCAWWGVSAFPYRLPPDYARFYRDRVSDTDTLAEAATASVGRAIRFEPQDFSRSPGLSQLTGKFGIQQALCTVLVTPTLNLVMFISLYRHRGEPLFSESERQFCEWVSPHLWTTWTANWIAQMESIRANSSSSRSCHAILDQRAVVHSADARFVELIRREWPRWQGPALPAALASLSQNQQEFRGRTLVLRAFRANGLVLMEAREHSVLDCLSARERTIAASFGAGQSYKQIASRLGLSPATVRHYLRRIYAKANISNKSELTRLVGLRPADNALGREPCEDLLVQTEI
jgi:DNA-binding CsgD family transcriptional regulator